MKAIAVITFIICTSFSAFTLAEDTVSSPQSLMFVGSVVQPPCTTSHVERELTLSCLNNVTTGVEIEKYDVASLAKMSSFRSKHKTIALSHIRNKPGLARITVAYD